MLADWITRQAWLPLWALVWHFSIITGILVCAVAWVMFVPVYKKLAFTVAVSMFVGLIFATVYTKLGANYVQAKWDAANRADIAAAEKARMDAETYFPPATANAPVVRLRNDPYDRDNSVGKSVPAHHLFQHKGQPADHPTNPGS